MNAQPSVYYFVQDAELLSNGVLRIRTGGSDGQCLFDGVYEVPPDSPDYEFWIWLKQRQKRPWFGSVSGIEEQTIAKYHAEYNSEHA